MPGFDATLEEFQSASALLADVGGALRSELVSLTSELDSLSAVWRGGAASAFQHGWSEWELGAREAIGALETMSGLLRATGDGYGRGEQYSRSGVVGAGQGLGF
jgi:WXG100 family type VII secretion target